MEIIEEEIVCVETNIFGNVGLAACSEPPRRPVQTTSQVGSSNVLSFMSDQWGFGATSRGGHEIPKCSPCPSVFFLMPLGLSICFRVFFGWRVRMFIIRTAEIPKIGKTGVKIRASIYLKTSESVFSKKC